ncbi:MAG: IscS subfamily cysteine desulfurase [Ruminobacter sp.]|uniref:cysteine desulfurase n=1 Tax=Ruminobacter amylophilus TaxID=867 RepID=A0A662ZEF8_9GAMM|nr:MULTISPECIES: IscS subfamily cysteine desulfurase [Ruminobacter]MBQ3776159.1 IscS subfamily cysteine desulfurase [Ruminobacter sp.]SFP01237.1 cysteine desulfurase IscS [Ruminobacter amylophilus]
MKLPVYLDYAATTPVDARVIKKMSDCLSLEGIFGNPASKSHVYGWQAAEAVDIARGQIAELIGADTREIVFTSGATECDNLAITGVALAHMKGNRKKIITSAIEHKAVLDPCHYVETLGFEVVFMQPNQDGLITPEMLEQVIDDNTLLVSLMHANNEIGVIQDIEQLAKVAKAHGALFHSDCAQSAGKVEIDVNTMPVDYLSLCAHKVYGPKGIGAFYVRKGAPKPNPVIRGGGHEMGMRSGTLATHQIAGMGEAFALAKAEMKKENARIEALRDKLARALLELPETSVNGTMEHRLPGNLNVTFRGINGENFMLALRNIAVSTGSACTSASLNPSYVLKALGLSDADAHSSIRFSLGRFTTEEEIDYAIEIISSEYLKQRKLGNLWSV